MPFTPTRDRVNSDQINTTPSGAPIGSRCAPRRARLMNGCKA